MDLHQGLPVSIQSERLESIGESTSVDRFESAVGERKRGDLLDGLPKRAETFRQALR